MRAHAACWTGAWRSSSTMAVSRAGRSIPRRAWLSPSIRARSCLAWRRAWPRMAPATRARCTARPAGCATARMPMAAGASIRRRSPRLAKKPTRRMWPGACSKRITPHRATVMARPACARSTGRWALGKQQPNGWFASNCLDNPALPLSHTIGYVLRGLLEAHRFSARTDLLDAAVRTGSSIAKAVAADGYLPGRLGPEFLPGADYACLTGSAQNAHCLLLLYQLTGERRYLDAGLRLNRYVRRTIAVNGPEHARGGVKGSFPVDGDYGTWAYLNWAAKFCIDANLLELEIHDA